MPRVIYSHHYNIGLFGLERLHPFDSRKYGRARRGLKDHFGQDLRAMWVRPRRPAGRNELRHVHDASYLDQLRQPACVAAALEVSPVARVPAWLLDWCVLRPMRWAVRGSVIAAEQAMDHGLAVNLGGGYHHAKPTQGEGYCVYSDIGLAIDVLRRSGRLADTDRVVYIDLDAHQGNGVCHVFMNDQRVFIFDMYNATVYPGDDAQARRRIDCDVPITTACHEREYLHTLKHRLPSFLDSLLKSQTIALAIYNAGTDIHRDDPLGGLSVSAEGILERDLFVAGQIRQRRIPMLMLLSGGYTRISYKLVADSVISLLSAHADHF